MRAERRGREVRCGEYERSNGTWYSGKIPRRVLSSGRGVGILAVFEEELGVPTTVLLGASIVGFRGSAAGVRGFFSSSTREMTGVPVSEVGGTWGAMMGVPTEGAEVLVAATLGVPRPCDNTWFRSTWRLWFIWLIPVSMWSILLILASNASIRRPSYRRSVGTWVEGVKCSELPARVVCASFCPMLATSGLVDFDELLDDGVRGGSTIDVPVGVGVREGFESEYVEETRGVETVVELLEEIVDT